jgi:hypothetical protein
MKYFWLGVYQTLNESTRGRARDESHKHKIKAAAKTNKERQ